MDGQAEEWTGGWMIGWLDGWIDGGWMEVHK